MTARLSFLLDTDAEEREELAALGVPLTPPAGATAVEIDAFASDLLRLLGEAEADRARYEEALTAEIQRLRMRYGARINRAAIRANMLRRSVCALAETQDFGGKKKKSREVGYGSYGRRFVPAAVKIVDQAQAIAWAEAEQLGVVEIIEMKKLPHKVLAPIVLDIVRETGEVPPGFDVIAEHEENWCKAETT